MTSHAIDEVTAALRACEDAGMPADRVGASLGRYRVVFLTLCGRPSQVSEEDKGIVARRLRQALAIWRLEQECRAGHHVAALTRYGS